LHSGEIVQWVSRHYAQPWNEKNLNLALEFNKKVFNREPIEKDLDMGKFLGYRYRDRMLWKKIGLMPKFLQEAIYYINMNLTHAAYQADAVRQANKIIQKKLKL
jgi:hypothetical protein